MYCCFCASCTAVENLMDIKRELGHYPHWQALGLNLGLSPDFLELIMEEHHLTTDRLMAVLLEWLKRNYDVEKYGLPSWSALVNAVQPINSALALTIKNHHLY